MIGSRSLDTWQEIFESVLRNKLRAFLTGLAVAWGIFMLIVLLGAGQGIQNQVLSNFQDRAVNSISLRASQTSLPFQGNQVGRKIRFTNKDVSLLQAVPGVEHVAASFHFFGFSYSVSYGSESASFPVTGILPAHHHLEKTAIPVGRYINDIDISKRRKVAIIGTSAADFFFKEDDPIGKILRIGGVPFTVVGTFQGEQEEGEMEKVYIPLTTAQQVFNGQNVVHRIAFTVGASDLAESIEIEQRVKSKLASHHTFSPLDPRAVLLRNNLEQFHKFSQLFLIINVFLWLVGIGTIAASVVGVSNILLISVAERTTEIGLRKALGATPFSIVSLILKESLLITGIAGYGGLVAGVFLLELVSKVVPQNDYLKNPEVNLSIAILALVVLIVAGLLAGYIPARRAAQVSPVVALRKQ